MHRRKARQWCQKTSVFRQTGSCHRNHSRDNLTRPIDWELVRQQYDQMIKYTTALRLSTAETEAILRRFTKKNVQHPTYKAFAKLGKAIKAIFLCRYLHSKELRRAINEGLNVVEQWNGATDFVFFARRGEMASNRRGSRNQHARAAPDPELHGLRQYVDDSEGARAAALAGKIHATRLYRPDAADLGVRQPVWTIRPRYECQAGVAVIKMAAGDTTACSTLNQQQSFLWVRQRKNESNCRRPPSLDTWPYPPA